MSTSPYITAQGPGRVLVVDDDPLGRRLLRDLFGANGYEVDEATDGRDALDRVRARRPDVILLDVMMPRVDGFDVCRSLKADAETAHIPVLLITALHDRGDRIKGIACGANDFITKPIDTEEVLLRAGNALLLKRLYDERAALLSARETLSDLIVHDIRNPLLGITVTALQIPQARTLPDAAALARTVLDQAELIDRFVSDLLDVSRMEHAGFELKRSREELGALLCTAAEEQRPQARERDIRLLVESPAGAAEAELDKALFARLLQNLLSNAIKFSPKGGTIWLRVGEGSAPDAPLKVQVADEGPGIPITYRDMIFEKYACVKMKEFGVRQSGLGLLFCRMVAEAHGGRIYVEPREPRGSTFTVELPRPRPD